ncbi:MAG: putative molybdenum carrier protein, partial [Verrucomicrobiota bacterium]
MLRKLVSGGQTGVDRAALQWALKRGWDCGGWCPAGRLAEDGAIESHFPLQETPSAEYSQRTEWNVRDSDGTVLLTRSPKLEGGTKLTKK